VISINTYTGNGFRLGRMAGAGTYVRISESADAREYDDFTRGLRVGGMMADRFVRWHPRIKCNVYIIEKLLHSRIDLLGGQHEKT